MKRINLSVLLILLAITVYVTSADAAPQTKGQLPYEEGGSAVQAFAPNFFQLLTVASTSLELKDTMTLYWEIYSPVQCIAYIAATNSKAGVAFTVPANERIGQGRGYGMTYAIYSGCAGADYRAARGNFWTAGQ
jgi:hypothetical protein